MLVQGLNPGIMGKFEGLKAWLLTAALFLSAVAVEGQEILPWTKFGNVKDAAKYNIACDYFNAGRYDDVLRQLDKLGKHYSLHPAVNRMRALSYQGLAQYDDALIAISKAIAKYPDAAFMYAERAEILACMKRYNLAAGDFYSYLLMEPGELTILYNLAWCLNEIGLRGEAIRILEECEVKDCDLLYLLAGFYAGKEEYEAAIITLEELERVQPRHFNGLEDLSVYYYQVDEFSKAITTIDKVIAGREDYGRGYFLKGLYYQQLGMDNQAEHCFEEARRLGYLGTIE